MAKVITTPCIVCIQSIFYGKEYSKLTKLSLIVICVGVTIASVTDIQINLLGTIIALSGVLVTSLYQIWVGTQQKELSANSMQLLYYQAPMSVIILIPLAFIFEDIGRLKAYEISWPSLVAIISSAFLAFFVNISVFLIIGNIDFLSIFFFFKK